MSNPVLQGYVAPGLNTYDIAFENEGLDSMNDIWVATDQSDSPIRAYNPTGTLTYACDAVENVRGLAFSFNEGHRYLWASNPVDGMIHQIDLDPTGIGGGVGGGIGSHEIEASSNPVTGAVTFTGSGFGGDAVIEVYNVAGNLVLSESFDGSFTWHRSDGHGSTVPAGVYLIVARDGSGCSASLAVTCLRD